MGVAGYQVHRSDTDGFTPDSSTPSTTLLDTVTDGTTYTDTTVDAGDQYYVVIAVDAAGNTSPASNQATALDPAAPVTVEVPVAADTMVYEAYPTTTYGSAPYLTLLGDPELTGLLRFELPELAAGQVVTGAQLQLRTTDIGWAGYERADLCRCRRQRLG